MAYVFVPRFSERQIKCFVKDAKNWVASPAYKAFELGEGLELGVRYSWHPHQDGIHILFPTEEVAIKFKLTF